MVCTSLKVYRPEFTLKKISPRKNGLELEFVQEYLLERRNFLIDNISPKMKKNYTPNKLAVNGV